MFFAPHALTIQNVRCFEHVQVELGQRRARGQVVVVLGENGSGKTTLLQCMALALVRPGLATALVELLEPGNGLVRGEGVGRVQVDGSDGRRLWVELINGKRAPARVVGMDDPDRPEVFAYGCHRGTALGGPAREVRLSSVDAVASLFDPHPRLIHAATWLIGLEGLALKDREGPAQRFFDAVTQTLAGLLESVDEVYIDEGAIRVRGALGDVPLTALSDGYLTTLGWTCDLIARWAEPRRQDKPPPDGDFAGAMTGVVLVDEIDLHLHPRWQARVISSIRNAFPRMSFVLTTHSPITLGSLEDGDVVLALRREGSGPSQVEALDASVKGLNADQVLTGPWFSMETTLDHGTRLKLGRHRNLLRAGARRPEHPDHEELERLESDLRERLGHFAETSTEKVALALVAEVMEGRPEDRGRMLTEERESLKARLRQQLEALSGA